MLAGFVRIIGLAVLAWAGAAQAQTIKVDPALMQQMMQAMQNQEINIKQYRDSGRNNCDETRFVACEAGYDCTTMGYDGKQSASRIQGMKGGKCHVTTLNHDGSTGDCYFTKPFMAQMMSMYQRDTIKIGEATAMGNLVMNQCTFKDQAGKPVSMKLPMAASTGATQ